MMNTTEFKELVIKRNQFATDGQFEIPIIKKQDINLDNLALISCSNARYNDKAQCTKGVHFFVDDYRFEGIYKNPEKTLAKYKQYKLLLSPDFSLYPEMAKWEQISQVAKSRWCGAYWQSKGLKVIPTITWSDFRSFDFCFKGVEEGSIVAVGMIGCKSNKLGFMRGYNAMLEKIKPSTIICYGKPFKEMQGNLLIIDYIRNKEVA